MNKQLHGFDYVHAEESWKQDVIQTIATRHIPSHHYLKYALCILALLIIATTAAIAKTDTIKKWLQDLFTSSQPVNHNVKEPISDPIINVNDYVFAKLVGERCLLDNKGDVYATTSCEDLKLQTVIHYQHASNQKTFTAQKQHMHITIPFEDRLYDVDFDYLIADDSLYVIEDQETKDMYVKAIDHSTSLVLVHMDFAKAMNEYLFDIKTMELTSIGNLQLEGELSSSQTIRKFAYDTHVSSNQEYVLYRSSLVNNVWVDRKEEQVWMVKNMKTGEANVLDEANGGLIGNEITFISPHEILMANNKPEKGSLVPLPFPMLFDCNTKRWTAYRDYDYTDNQQFYGMVTKANDKSYTILDLNTKKTDVLPYPHADKYMMLPYPNIYVVYDEFNKPNKVYLKDQKRWYDISNDDQMPEISMITPLNEHQLLINQDYVITFYEP